jgi:hypothetical protein
MEDKLRTESGELYILTVAAGSRMTVLVEYLGIIYSSATIKHVITKSDWYIQQESLNP